MAEVVFKERFNYEETEVAIGGHLVDIITAGMYSNPLMAIREYVQNACDSIDEAVSCGLLQWGEDRIQIAIDPVFRTISVQDNGVGLPGTLVKERLCSIGKSGKRHGKNRGFRGIGRLGGAAYCRRVLFETRGANERNVQVVAWDGDLARSLSSDGSGMSAGEVLHEVLSVSERLPDAETPEHFFRVTMEGVKPFHRDELMSMKELINFVGSACPSKYNEEFSFAREIEESIENVNGYRSYHIYVNDEPVFKPYTNTYSTGKGGEGRIDGIVYGELYDRTGKPMGWYWFANTKFLSSIPHFVRMRGIRIRQGNIQIGDEYVLSPFYSERRFASWNIGEIHLDYTLKANARRDGFEQDENCEALYEQLTVLCRRLSKTCRTLSRQRSLGTSAELAVSRVEALVSEKVVVLPDHLKELCSAAEARLAILRKQGLREEVWEGAMDRLRACSDMEGGLGEKEDLSSMIHQQKVSNKTNKELICIISRSLLDCYDGRMSKEKLLYEVLKPFLTKKGESTLNG